MATITLNIPDTIGVDLTELKSEVDQYTQHLISALSHDEDKKDIAISSNGKKMSSLFGAMDITREDSLDDMRFNALQEKYDL